MELININRQEGIDLLWEGYQKLHKILRIEQCPNEYYAEVSKLFKNADKAFFMKVIQMMVGDYRGYYMPAVKDFKQYMARVRENEPRPVSITYKEAYTPTEEDQEYAKKLVADWAKKNPSEAKEVRHSIVEARHSEVIEKDKQGLEYCLVAHQWVLKGTADKAKEFYFLGESGKTNFNAGIK